MNGRQYCTWCRVVQDGCRLVGVVERASAAAHPVYACPGCRRVRRLILFADHPPGTDGTPRVAPQSIRA